MQNLVTLSFPKFMLALPVHLNTGDLMHGQLISVVLAKSISRNQISVLNATPVLISTVISFRFIHELWAIGVHGTRRWIKSIAISPRL